MKKMTPDELRSSYLEFFRSKDHTVVASAPLVPDYDPTLLFTGAGMNQFKDDFLGKGTRSYTRATSSQKCLRTQDLEVVGTTNFHHTFFEMLGNFSFGDYFKREAITWAWEYITKHLHMPADRIHVSVFQEDDEAFNIWKDEVGIPEKRIWRFGPKDNYWPANSPNDKAYRGPCGPCSEIFYDFGEKWGPPDDNPSSDTPRFCEFWNLVFQQFEKVGDGPETLVPLPRPGIDTGSGFERVLALLHGKHSNYETPLLRPLCEQISGMVDVEYEFDMGTGAIVRRIADHIRGAVFCIADGVWVENQGRGYVLRKIIRRAVRDGRQLGIDGVFLTKLVEPVISQYSKSYPELGDKQGIILDLLKNESEAFLRTLDRGEAKIKALLDNPADPAWVAPLDDKYALPDKPPRKLAKMVEAGELEMPELPKQKHAKPPKGVLSGEVVFDLEQTYGFPGDVTKFILREVEREIDPIGYVHAEIRHIMVSKGEGGEIKQAFDTRLDEAKHRVGKTEFIGYTDDHVVLGSEDYVVIDEHGKTVDELKKGQTAELYCRITPFYAEQGGQVGDTGFVMLHGKKNPPDVVVTDCQLAGDMRTHVIKVLDGTLDLKKRPKLELRIDTTRRDAIRRHHTATHLLHHALRSVLGDHVHQKGSLVAPDRLRFDFTHTESMTPDQIDEIEKIANRSVFEDAELTTDLSTPDEAKKRGAMALFGEKYGDTVRVVACGPTIELCGGTHVRRAGEIGGVRIVNQASSAAGVRRIEALCGDALLEFQQTERRLLSGIAEKLKTPADRIPDAIERLQKQLKEARDEAKKAASAASSSAEPDFASGPVKAFWLPDDTSRDALKNFADKAAESFGKEKGVVFCAAGKSMVAKANQPFVDGGGSVGDLIKKHGAAHGIRGGGSAVFVQGKAPDTRDALMAFAQSVADNV